MIRIRADWKDFDDWPGTIANQQVISEYSVNADHSVISDQSHARYLIEENVQDGVNLDLKIGHDLLGTHIDKRKHHRGVPSLQPIIRWAVGQDGATIKEVFGGADFATRRGTMNKIASTLFAPTKSWSLSAQDFGGVVLLSDMSEMYSDFVDGVGAYSGFKFEQYMTASEPNGLPDTTAPVDNRSAFYRMVRSDLETRGQRLKLCVCGELDAFSGDEPIELKTCKRPYFLKRDISKIMQSEMAGVKRIVVGVKMETGEFIVGKVVDMSLEELKSAGSNRERTSQCYAFLLKVLTEIKDFLFDNDACRVSYNHKTVVIQSITRQRARADFGKEKGENGDFLTDKLRMRFNL